jgi:hypothetical protein
MIKTKVIVLDKIYLERPSTISKPFKIKEAELDNLGLNEVILKI